MLLEIYFFMLFVVAVVVSQVIQLLRSANVVLNFGIFNTMIKNIGIVSKRP